MATVMPKTAKWFTYFQEDYRWSSAVSGILGSAPWGGSDIGEVDRVCRPLRDALGNDDAWFDAWCAEGELQQTRAREADERKHDGEPPPARHRKQSRETARGHLPMVSVTRRRDASFATITAQIAEQRRCLVHPRGGRAWPP